MSVYQVEEYYVFRIIPVSKIDAVKHALDNTPAMGSSEASWCGNEVTIEPFDCENYAQEVDDLIDEVIES